MESFHGRFLDECFYREHFWTMTEARVVIGDYRDEYNRLRPRGGLGYSISVERPPRPGNSRSITQGEWESAK